MENVNAKKLPDLSKMSLIERLHYRFTNPKGMFYDEKLIGDTPFVEKPVPENPTWMEQPAKDAPLPWWLRPIKFHVAT